MLESQSFTMLHCGIILLFNQSKVGFCQRCWLSLWTFVCVFVCFLCVHFSFGLFFFFHATRKHSLSLFTITSDITVTSRNPFSELWRKSSSWCTRCTPPSPRTRTHCGDVLMRGTCRWCSSYRIDDHRGYETVTKHQASQLVFKCPRFPSFSLSVSLSVFSLFFLVLYPEVVTFDRLRTSPQNWYNSKKTSVIGKY